jgi:putative addiction module component (TIGR02574 family)
MAAKLKIPREFDEVSGDQRIAFVQDLWDRIAQDPDRVLVPNEHKQLLDERLNAYRLNPQAGRPWGEVRDQLLAKLRST